MSIELKRKKLELSRVQTAKMELEFKIEERMEEINRLKEHVKVQAEKELQLIKELAENKE
jgi:hypothetical protein